ncbi:HD domain-containing phosphohydrolase [Deinococcus xianganensis]|uniref:GAF domain-containing protein n=1 Tax=Deinococcus xianganensis TaxID=1507289 RepID=A0A6I4YM52_9DEIO|nr:HD domain-containing phosphohydrolase [Deinococcus xianganensis]MXV20936.1 GAF domain-containing protein [Deinococcus xianganensis]
MTGDPLRPDLPETLRPALEAQALVLLAQSSRDMFEQCVTLALEITGAGSALALLYRQDTDELEIVAAAGEHRQVAVGRHLPRGQGLAWRVVQSGQATLIPRTDQDPQTVYVSGQPMPHTYLGVPLLDPDGRVLGVLSVNRLAQDTQFGSGEAQALTLLGQAASVAYSRARALEDAQRAARQFEQLAQLSAELADLSSPEEIGQRALRTLVDLSGFTVGAVVMLDGAREVQLSVLEGHPLGQAAMRAVLSASPAPSGLIGEALRTGRTQTAADYQTWPQRRTDVPNVFTGLAAPLRVNGRVVGVVTLLHLVRRVPVPASLVTLLDTVALRISQALDRADSVEHLHATREAALRTLGRMLESRDGDTFGHTDRVTTLALRLAGRLGLSDTQRQHLRWGAYLHDIGKVAVDDRLLRKAGPLTPVEREAMQWHVEVGDQLLREEVFVPREVREVVRHHHERWDGGGYPDRLAGPDIPLLARIFSVADVFDALVSPRPYKLAWSVQAAADALREQSGRQFDPAVVVAFLDVLREDGLLDG